MRLLSLDFDPLFGDEEDVRSTFASSTSTFDFDVVIWDPRKTVQSYGTIDSFRALPSFDLDDSARILNDLERRRQEFDDYLKTGRTLVVIGRSNTRGYVLAGGSQTSGVKSNTRSSETPQVVDFTSALPVDFAGFAQSSGRRVEILGDGPIGDHLRRNHHHLYYTATMTSPPGDVLAKVPGTNRAIASLLRVQGGGNLLVLPDTVFKPQSNVSGDGEDFGDKWSNEAVEYQASLLEALAALQSSTETHRPRWAKNFATRVQQEIRADVTRKRAEIEQSEQDLAELTQKSRAVDAWDQLYLGTGRALELQVKELLALMGGEVQETLPGRDDWRVAFGEDLAVVEVKGVRKSASEKYAAQLEKWVAGALEETGKSHKGILVVNTWRETPLDKRTEEDFPRQMMPYSLSRSHLLVTGLELFIIALQIQDDPGLGEFWREKFMTSVGRLSEVGEWSNYIYAEEPRESGGGEFEGPKHD